MSKQRKDNELLSKPESRRKAIIKIIGMSAATGLLANVLPSKWVKPAVTSMVLPAHAQTSDIATPPFDDECAEPAVGEAVFDIPGTYEFTVPECATSLEIEVLGAGGGSGGFNTAANSESHAGGNGGRVSASVPAVPGEVITIVVAQGGGGGIPETMTFGSGGSGDATGGDGAFVAFSPDIFVGGGGGGGASSVTAASLGAIRAAGGGGGGATTGVAEDSSTAAGGAGAGINGVDGESASGEVAGVGVNDGGSGGAVFFPEGQPGGNGSGGAGAPPQAGIGNGLAGSDGFVQINYS